MLHTTGSTPFAALRKEIVEKTGLPVHEGDFFRQTRTKKDGTFSDEKAKQAVEAMDEMEAQHTQEDGTCSIDTAEILAAVVGPNKKGRRRGHGRTLPRPRCGDMSYATLQSLREELREETVREVDRLVDVRLQEAWEEARREVRAEYQSQFQESFQAALAVMLANLPQHLRVPPSFGSQSGASSSDRPTRDDASEDGGRQ